MRGGAVELRAVGVRPPGDVPRKLDHRDLHPQTDPQIRDTPLSGVLRRQHHALNAPVAEASGHQNAAAPRQHFADVLRRQTLGIHPPYVHLRAAGGPRVEQGLRHAEIRVVQLRVLAHQRDGHVTLGGGVDLRHHAAPLRHIRRALAKSQPAAHHPAQPLFFQQQRHLV